MKCQDVDTLLPLFFDGELDSRRMRDVALHTARCRGCESQLRDLETVQAHLQQTVKVDLDTVDFSGLWTSIERRLPPPRDSFWQRLRARWDLLEPWDWSPALPAAAAVAATAVAGFFLFSASEPTAVPQAERIASTDYSSSVERLDTVFDSFALFSDPDTQTTVLWVGDEAPGEDP